MADVIHVPSVGECVELNKRLIDAMVERVGEKYIEVFEGLSWELESTIGDPANKRLVGRFLGMDLLLSEAVSILSGCIRKKIKDGNSDIRSVVAGCLDDTQKYIYCNSVVFTLSIASIATEFIEGLVEGKSIDEVEDAIHKKYTSQTINMLYKGGDD